MTEFLTKPENLKHIVEGLKRYIGHKQWYIWKEEDAERQTMAEKDELRRIFRLLDKTQALLPPEEVEVVVKKRKMNKKRRKPSKGDKAAAKHLEEDGVSHELSQ